MLVQNITSDVLIERSDLLFTGFSDGSGLVTSLVTQMTPKSKSSSGATKC